MLEKETSEIELRYKAKLPADLLEILSFVHDNNRLGIKPTYSKIGIELNTSKPTVRKRVRNLINRGYLVESTMGNSKVIELTEKGSRIFLSR